MRKLNTNIPTVHWREIPLVRLLLPFVVGIYLTEVPHSFQKESVWFLCGLFIGLYSLGRSSFSFNGRWISGIYISFFFLLLGYIVTGYQEERTAVNYFDKHLQTENKILGIVTSYPKENTTYTRFKFTLQNIQGRNGSLLACTGTLQVTIKNTPYYTLPQYGDQLFLVGKIDTIKGPRNPSNFDYRQYLHLQNIHHQLFVDTMGWKILERTQAPMIFQAAHSFQQNLIKRLAKYVHSTESFSIAAAMALGHKAAMTSDIKAAYSESGAIHVLAVSGLHVGILSEVLLLLLGFFSSRKPYLKWLKYISSLVLIWAFVLLVGATDSVVRAGILFSFINFGRLTRRDIHALNALAAAAFIILVIDPYALFQVGFQFSFLAVTGIIVGFKSIYNLWIPKFKVAHFFWQLTAVGISAQLFVMPLSVYYFHQLPLYSVLSGLLVVPFAALILYATIALLVSSFISIPLASSIGIALSWLIAFQNKFIFLIQKIPYHRIQGIWLEWYDVLLIYGIIISLLLFIRSKTTIWVPIALCGISLFLGVRAWQLISSYQQQLLVIYALPKETVIDFVDGRKLVSWHSNLIARKTMDFNVEPNRWAMNIQERQVIEAVNSFESTFGSTFESKRLYVDKSYLQFGDRRLIIVDSTLSVVSQNALDCTYVLVRDNPKLSMKEVMSNYNMTLVIFDGTNTRYKIRQWKKECEAIGLNYYDIKKQGAFIDDLTYQTFSSAKPRISSK